MTTFPAFNETKDDSFKDMRIKISPVKGVDGRIGFIDADG